VQENAIIAHTYGDCLHRCLRSQVSPWLWPESKILYGIAIHNATLYGLALGLWHSHRFVGLISVCGHRLNGLDCLLRTPEKLAGTAVHLVQGGPVVHLFTCSSVCQATHWIE